MESGQIYEAMHPETKHGGDHKSPGARRKNQDAESASRSFTKDTAKKTGIASRTIAEDVQIGTHLAALVLLLTVLGGGTALAATPTPTPTAEANCAYLELTPMANADDANAQATNGVPDTFTDSSTLITIGKFEVAGTDIEKVGLFRFPTGGIPDEATVVRADLDLATTSITITGGNRRVVAQYSGDSTAPWVVDDYTDLVTAQAINTLVSAVTVSSPDYFTFPLQGVGQINRSGSTNITVGVSGCDPTSTNGASVNVGALEHATAPPPRLRVYYCTVCD